MNPKILTIIKYILLLSITAALMVFAFRGINVGDVIHEMMKANIPWVLFSVLLSIIAMVSRAYRWKLLIESTGYNPPLKKTFYALMIGYFANLAFPRLGEVTRCGTLSKDQSIPFTSLLGTVIIERVVDVISLFICILLVSILEFKRLGDFLTENITHPIALKWKQLMNSPIVILVVLILIAFILFTIFYFTKRSNQQNKEPKLIHWVKDLLKGLRAVANLERPWLFIFHSVFIWGLYFLSTYVCIFALPTTSHLGLSAALFLLVAGGLGMSAPVQGGIGAYHLLVSQGLMLYGLSQQDGLTFATLVHTLSLVIVVLFGVVSLLLLYSENKKK